CLNVLRTFPAPISSATRTWTRRTRRSSSTGQRSGWRRPSPGSCAFRNPDRLQPTRT
ncbi:hypothetical protein, partial [Arthrobacter sp. DR-2P]